MFARSLERDFIQWLPLANIGIWDLITPARLEDVPLSTSRVLRECWIIINLQNNPWNKGEIPISLLWVQKASSAQDQWVLQTFMVADRKGRLTERYRKAEKPHLFCFLAPQTWGVTGPAVYSLEPPKSLSARVTLLHKEGVSVISKCKDVPVKRE